MRPRLWVLAAAVAALATGSAACGTSDEHFEMGLGDQRSGASIAARSGGFASLLEDDVRTLPLHVLLVQSCRLGLLTRHDSLCSRAGSPPIHYLGLDIKN